jgi:hypothetical protein
MLAKAAELGLDTSALRPVTQEGCLYGAAAPGSSSDASDDASSGVAVAAVPASSKKQQSSGKAAGSPASNSKSSGSGSSAKVASVPAALDPLAVTQKVEFNISVGGKPAGSVVLGMFGNAAPKTVQNVSAGAAAGSGLERQDAQHCEAYSSTIASILNLHPVLYISLLA